MAPTRSKNAAPPPVLANGHDKPAEGVEADIIVDETGETEIVDGAASPAAAAETVDPGVASLKEQLDASERRRIAAESEVTRLAGERSKDQTVISDSRLLVIESTIQTNETKKADIMRRMKDAKEAGDYDAETNAAAELAEVTLDLKQAKLGKARLEDEIEDAKTAPKPPASTGDALEDWLGTQTKMGEQSKRWLREHRDYVEDPEKNAELTLAHTRAVKAGHKENSPGYFAAIETELGLDDEAEPEVIERRQAPPSAPVSRSGQMSTTAVKTVPGLVQTGPGKYRIDTNTAAGRALKEAADISGLTTAEYVKEALKLQRGSDGQLH